MLSERLRAAVSDVRGGDTWCIGTAKAPSGARGGAYRRPCVRAGIEVFAFHDLKAKGISDHQDNLEGTEALRCVRPMCVICRKSRLPDSLGNNRENRIEW